jgi:hypothetical protein
MQMFVMIFRKSTTIVALREKTYSQDIYPDEIKNREQFFA